MSYCTLCTYHGVSMKANRKLYIKRGEKKTNKQTHKQNKVSHITNRLKLPVWLSQ